MILLKLLEKSSAGGKRGGRAFSKLEKQIKALEPEDILVIDLSGVRILNPSYADETIGQAFVKYPGKIQIVGQMTLAVEKGIEEVEKSRQIQILRVLA